jgi:hypothetical protein
VTKNTRNPVICRCKMMKSNIRVPIPRTAMQCDNNVVFERRQVATASELYSNTPKTSVHGSYVVSSSY